MSFGQAITHVFKNYVNYRGRASRSEFWWFFLFMLIVSVILNVIIGVGIATSADQMSWDRLAQVGVYASLLWFLVTVLPVSALWFRRLHDSNKSGWWLLLIVICGILGFVLYALSALQNQALFAAGSALMLLSSVGWIVLVIFALLPGTPGPNRYGDVPASSRG